MLLQWSAILIPKERGVCTILSGFGLDHDRDCEKQAKTKSEHWDCKKKSDHWISTQVWSSQTTSCITSLSTWIWRCSMQNAFWVVGSQAASSYHSSQPFLNLIFWWSFNSEPKIKYNICSFPGFSSLQLPGLMAIRSEAEGNNLDRIRRSLYPAEGGLMRAMVQLVPKAWFLEFALQSSSTWSNIAMVTIPKKHKLENIIWGVRLMESLEVPYGWRHAGLAQMRDFLRNERDHGRFHPILSGGLDD